VSFLLWLQESGFAEWIRTSVIGYPIMITLHSIGLAIIGGIAFALNFRLLGRFKDIPLESISRLVGVAWIGWWINLVSGVALFTMEATSYVTNTPFLLKFAFVVLAVISLNRESAAIKREGIAGTGELAIPTNLRALAVASLVFWLGAIVTGRLIAYLG
jgi:Trk-type K+ transport system membrane component